MKGVNLPAISVVTIVVVTLFLSVTNIINIGAKPLEIADVESIRFSNCKIFFDSGCKDASRIKIENFDADKNGVLDENDDFEDLCNNYYGNSCGSVCNECKYYVETGRVYPWTPPTGIGQTTTTTTSWTTTTTIPSFSDSLKIMRFTLHNNFHSSYTPDGVDHRNDGPYISERTDMHQSGNNSAPCDTLQNNGIHCLAYFNVRAISTNINPNTHAWRLLNNTSQYVTAKKWYTNFVVDPMNEEFREWAKDYVQDWKDRGFTGVWLDNGIDQDIATHVENSMTGWPINPRTRELYKDDDWRNDRIDFANWLQQQFPDMLFVANALWNGGTYENHVNDFNYIFNNLEIDGLFSEGTFSGVDPAPIWRPYTWEQSVEMIEAIQDSWLSKPEKFFIWYSQVPNAVRDNALAISRDQIAKFIFTSALMGVSKSGQNYVEAHNHMADADTQDLYKIDIGTPVTDFHGIPGTEAFERDFTNVKILVNPTGNPTGNTYTINLDGEYQNLNGENVTSVTLPPFTGEILYKSKGPSVDVKKYIAYNWRLFWQGNEYRDYSGCWDMIQMHYEPAVSDNIPNRIKQADPDVEILLYRNTRAVYEREAEELQLFRQNNWTLKTSSGEEIVSRYFPNNFMVDKGNPDYQEWFANWMQYYVETYGYDGAYLDNSLFGSSENMWYTMGVNSGCDAQSYEEDGCPPINPRTKTYWTNDNWIDADVGLINKVKEKLGDKPVVLNGVNNGRKFFDSSRHNNYVAVMEGSNMDGFVIELWMNDGSGNFYSEDNWKKSVDMIVWIEENLPKAGIVTPVGTGWADIPESISNDDFAIYSFASLLLGASSDRYYMLQTPGGAELQNSIGEDVYCRPTVQTLHDIDIGNPVESYNIIVGTRVYERNFENGKVFVNPTSTPYSVQVVGNYRHLDGRQAPNFITINGHRAEILLRV